MIRHIFKRRNKNNKGAALITVIIILAFISILCTVILYIAAVNYRMKKADFQSKVSFYSNEIALEEMQSELVEHISIAYAKALDLTNSKYYTYATVDARKDAFYHNFYDQFITTLAKAYPPPGTYDQNSIQFVANLMSGLTGIAYDSTVSTTDDSYHDTTRIYTIAYPHQYNNNGDLFIQALQQNGMLPGADGMAVTYIILPINDADTDGAYYDDFITLELVDPDTHLALDDDEIRVIFHNIFVVTVENNMMSVIKTDIAVQLPPVDWAGGTGTTGDVKFNSNEMIFYVNWQKR